MAPSVSASASVDLLGAGAARSGPSADHGPSQPRGPRATTRAKIAPSLTEADYDHAHFLGHHNLSAILEEPTLGPKETGSLTGAD